MVVVRFHKTMMTSNYQLKPTYNQYRTVLLDQTDALFTVLGTDGTESEDISDIYVLNIARARYKEQMDAGNWSLKLSGSAGVGEITLIDNSGKKFSDKVGKQGRVFDVVSGSLNLGTDKQTAVTHNKIHPTDKDLVSFIQTKD